MIGEKCPTPGDSLDKNTLKQTESSPSSSASAPAKWIKNDPEENLLIEKYLICVLQLHWLVSHPPPLVFI